MLESRMHCVHNKKMAPYAGHPDENLRCGIHAKHKTIFGDNIRNKAGQLISLDQMHYFIDPMMHKISTTFSTRYTNYWQN